MCDLRTGISDFHHEVLRQFALHGEVPLLRVAAAEISINRKHSLSQTSIRSGWKRRQMNYEELLGWLRGTRNGLGDIYQMDLSALNISR